MTSTFFYDDEMLLLKQDNDVSEGMLLQQQDNVQPISVDTTHLWSTDQVFIAYTIMTLLFSDA